MDQITIQTTNQIPNQQNCFTSPRGLRQINSCRQVNFKKKLICRVGVFIVLWSMIHSTLFLLYPFSLCVYILHLTLFPYSVLHDVLVHETVSLTSGQANTGWPSPTWATSYPKGARLSIKSSKISKTKIVSDFLGKLFSHFCETFLQKYTKITIVDQVKGLNLSATLETKGPFFRKYFDDTRLWKIFAEICICVSESFRENMCKQKQMLEEVAYFREKYCFRELFSQK